MDAFELLKNDHKKVSQLFEEIESASGQVKAQLFKRLKSELDLHAHIEETYLYPALENKKETRDITLEAYEEHRVVKDLLAELANGKAPSDEWKAKLKVLQENVDHHVEEEEGELFDKAEDVLSEQEVERLGEQMEAEKVRKQGGKAQGQKGQSAKPNSASRDDGSPGVLKRLANLVGLGDSSPKVRKSSKTRKTSKTKATRSSAASRTSKAKATKSTTKTTAGNGAGKSSGRSKSSSRSKSASKSRGAGKAGKGRAVNTRSSGKKAASRRTSSRKTRGR